MNYFTDNSIVEMANNCGASVQRYRHGEDDFTLRMSELKALMNLAVEAAIGEPILFAVPDWEYCLDRYSGQTLCAGKNTAIHKLPLYSVKELVN